MRLKRYLVEIIIAIFSVIFINGFIFGQSEAEKPIYLDPSQPVDKRVEDLLGRMTLEEKVGQMNMPCVYMGAYGRDIPSKFDGVKRFAEGTLVGIGPGGGFFTLANEILREGTHQQAEFFNELQKLVIG
jgi:beta-glucosidase